MSITAQTIIELAFKDIGAIAAGESPNTSELEDGLVRLNELLSSLNAEGATCWEKRSETRSLVQGSQSFTMGPSGDMVTDRPTRVLAARCYSGQYGRGLRVVTDAGEWTSYMERGILTLPLSLFVDYQSQNVVLHLTPAPTVAATLTLDLLEAQSSFVDDLPPELAQAMVRTLGRVVRTFTLTPGTSSYTLGPGGSGSFQVTRPAKVVSASAAYGSFRHTVDVIGSQQWSMLLEAENAGVILPIAIYPQYGYPNATMNFWPCPGSGVTAEIHSPRQISSFAALDSVVSLPPGFVEMLHFGLGVKLYPSYPRQGGMPAELAGNAADAKASVIANNIANGVFQSPQIEAQAARQRQADQQPQQQQQEQAQ